MSLPGGGVCRLPWMRPGSDSSPATYMVGLQEVGGFMYRQTAVTRESCHWRCRDTEALHCKPLYSVRPFGQGMKSHLVGQFVDKLTRGSGGQRVWVICDNYQPDRSIAAAYENK